MLPATITLRRFLAVAAPLCMAVLFGISVAAPAAHAQSSEDDLPPCYRAVRDQNLGSQGACVSMGGNNPTCPSDIPTRLNDPSLCGAGELCCYSTQGGVSTDGNVDASDDAATQAAAAAKIAANKPGAPVTLPDPLGGANLPVLIGNTIRVFISISGAVALLMFVYGGITWIISGGDSGKVKSAQHILMNASIGLVLIFGAYLFTASIIQAVLADPSGTTTMSQ